LSEEEKVSIAFEKEAENIRRVVTKKDEKQRRLEAKSKAKK